MPMKTRVAWMLPFLAVFGRWIRLIRVMQQPQPGLSSSSKLSPIMARTRTVRGLPVHPVYLRQNNINQVSSTEKSSNGYTSSTSPYCLAVSSITDLPSSSNFLATQVWPSARVAARALEMHGPSLVAGSSKDTFTVCELGCGPGLPSLTAASTLQCQVISTDIDTLALELVAAAATEQNLGDFVTTRTYDLILAEWEKEWMNSVDLFVMSDVFESKAIAQGAAQLTQHIMDVGSSSTSKIWVFAQSDRAQREVYLRELQRLFPNDIRIPNDWTSFECFRSQERLWLCDLDETKVNYG
ncbi:lysine methyltransferase [Nitzschia inconspicua]|uniref:Lysine methyltransferase n=1 Tax=Nitzschia inconspicua TaxID=303405 RepID=A0A9K3LLS6_9STRA|nr:lysine methyltransferase [Nitzschia inconspicua]